MASLHLEIITPEKTAYSDDVEKVTLPSAFGDMTILPRHIPLFAQLTDGELRIIKEGKLIHLSVGGGVVEISPKGVEILISRAVRADELNEAEILRAKKEAEEILAKKPTKEIKIAAEAAFRRSLIDLKVMRKVRRRI